jgi:hypothetical protein
LWPIVSAIELTAFYAIDFICHEKHKKAQKDEVAEINELCAVVRQTRFKYRIGISDQLWRIETLRE